MADSRSSEILVHYKGRYYCFDANGGSLSNATEQQEQVAEEAIAKGALLANLTRRASDASDGCQCFVLDVDALGAVRPHDDGRETGTFIAFNADGVRAFDAETLKPRPLSPAVEKSASRSFDEGLLVGTLVQSDGFGTNCTLISADLPVMEAGKPPLEQRQADPIVVHYCGRYYSIDTEGFQFAPASDALLDAAKTAIESGVKVAASSEVAGIGTLCTLVDLSAFVQNMPFAKPAAVLHHPDGRTQILNLLNGHMEAAGEELRTRTEEALAAGTWLARMPPSSEDLAGLTCYLLDLGALRRRQST